MKLEAKRVSKYGSTGSPLTKREEAEESVKKAKHTARSNKKVMREIVGVKKGRAEKKAERKATREAAYQKTRKTRVAGEKASATRRAARQAEMQGKSKKTTVKVMKKVTKTPKDTVKVTKKVTGRDRPGSVRMKKVEAAVGKAVKKSGYKAVKQKVRIASKTLKRAAGYKTGAKTGEDTPKRTSRTPKTKLGKAAKIGAKVAKVGYKVAKVATKVGIHTTKGVAKGVIAGHKQVRKNEGVGDKQRKSALKTGYKTARKSIVGFQASDPFHETAAKHAGIRNG